MDREQHTISVKGQMTEGALTRLFLKYLYNKQFRSNVDLTYNKAMENIKTDKGFIGISEYFTTGSYEKFNIRLNTITRNGSLTINNQGFIPVESFLYFIWIVDENLIDVFSFVENHEGIWLFHVYDSCEEKYIRDIIFRVHRFQEIDSQDITIIFVPTEGE